jgi:hypothetical protein
MLVSGYRGADGAGANQDCTFDLTAADSSTKSIDRGVIRVRNEI